MGICGDEPNGRTVQPTDLILITIEAEFCAIKNYIGFFSKFDFSFQVMRFSLKNAFLPEKLKFQTA